MEARDHQLILQLSQSNVQLKRLYAEHQRLERRLLKYSKRSFMTPTEEIEQRRLKKLKLQGVDRMMEILEQEHVQSAA